VIKVFTFLFFLIFSFLLTPWFADQTFYFFLARPSLYTPCFFLFWFAAAGTLTFLYYVILNNVSFRWGKVLLRMIVFCAGSFYIFFTIFIPVLATAWRFKGCGEEFNKAFEEAVKNKDNSLCYNLKSIKIDATHVKESANCLAPNKGYISIGLDQEHDIAMCIAALNKIK
jgi:hypothetical protein